MTFCCLPHYPKEVSSLTLSLFLHFVCENSRVKQIVLGTKEELQSFHGGGSKSSSKTAYRCFTEQCYAVNLPLQCKCQRVSSSGCVTRICTASLADVIVKQRWSTEPLLCPSLCTTFTLSPVLPALVTLNISLPRSIQNLREYCQREQCST